jgi:hypothetical protein
MNENREFPEVYEPAHLWFAHNPFGIHGISHAARVFVWANVIGVRLRERGEDLNLEALRWAAILHDVGRLSDGWDTGHGARSAEWTTSHRNSLPVTFPDEFADIVRYCCTWHETSDTAIPVMTAELKCLKDADGLDRVRIDDLNPGYLRSEPARTLVDHAWGLYRVTMSGDRSWGTVMKAARDGGYLDLNRFSDRLCEPKR